MELILIRNGETDYDAKNICSGKCNVSLNGKGERQSHTTARVFYNDQITAIYSSPIESDKKTADAINKYHNLPVDILEDLTDRDFGHWEGESFSAICEKYADEYEAYLLDWQGYEVPMGENALSAYFRNISAIKRVLSENPKGRVICVAHGDVIKNILSYFLELEPKGAWHFKVNNAAITRLDINEDGYATLLSFNEI